MTAPPFSHPDANCLGLDPNLFFPQQGDPESQQDRALAVCAECPAACRQACLDHAITHGEPGIWGGTTGRQRRRLIRDGVMPGRQATRGVRRPPGLTRSQILEELRAAGTDWTTTAQLAHRCGITKQSVSRETSRMVADGLIETSTPGYFRLVTVGVMG